MTTRPTDEEIRDDLYECAGTYQIKYLTELADALDHNIVERQAARDGIVVTKNEAGQIVAVTCQDKGGRVLEIIAESVAQPVMVPDEDKRECRFGDHYKAMFGHVETDAYCDWSPSRFRQSKKQEITP